MNQHNYVKQCQLFYTVNDLQPGNPDDGDWEVAHYPAPRGEGDCTVWLFHEHHQIQGLLQSEEWGRCCFFPPHTKYFLIHGPFVENWFELWDLCDKWTLELCKTAGHVGGANSHKNKDKQGKSKRALKTLGEYQFTTETAQRTHAKKLEDGRSKHAVEVCGSFLKQKFECLHTGFVSSASGVVRRQRRLGYDSSLQFRKKLNG